MLSSLLSSKRHPQRRESGRLFTPLLRSRMGRDRGEYTDEDEDEDEEDDPEDVMPLLPIFSSAHLGMSIIPYSR